MPTINNQIFFIIELSFFFFKKLISIKYNILTSFCTFLLRCIYKTIWKTTCFTNKAGSPVKEFHLNKIVRENVIYIKLIMLDFYFNISSIKIRFNFIFIYVFIHFKTYMFHIDQYWFSKDKKKWPDHINCRQFVDQDTFNTFSPE